MTITKINIASKNLRQDLIKLLFNSLIEVNFIKSDGTNRKMICTLKPSMIPKDLIPINKFSPYKNLNTLVVFDLEYRGWRSITLTRLKNAKVIES